jgi:hypothetical protein
VRIDIGGINGGCADNSTRTAQCVKHVLSHPLFAPPVEPVLDRRVGIVIRRAITPPGPSLQHRDDAGNHSPAFDSPCAAPSAWQIRLNPSPFVVA